MLQAVAINTFDLHLNRVKKMTVIYRGLNHREREEAIDLLASQKLPTADLPLSLNNFFYVKDGDRLVALIGLEKYNVHGLLRSMVVHPAYRNKNIASLLVQKIEETAIQENLKSVFLLTETASVYFEKKGYVKVDREKVPFEIKSSSEFSNVCPVSAAVMMKKTQVSDV